MSVKKLQSDYLDYKNGRYPYFLQNMGRNEDKQKLANLRIWAEKYARENGFVLSPDEKIVENILKGLLRNEEKRGARYCPCRLVSGDKEKDKAIICPCIYHRDEIERDGHCHCRLFVKPG